MDASRRFYRVIKFLLFDRSCALGLARTVAMSARQDWRFTRSGTVSSVAVGRVHVASADSLRQSWARHRPRLGVDVPPSPNPVSRPDPFGLPARSGRCYRRFSNHRVPSWQRVSPGRYCKWSGAAHRQPVPQPRLTTCSDRGVDGARCRRVQHSRRESQ